MSVRLNAFIHSVAGTPGSSDNVSEVGPRRCEPETPKSTSLHVRASMDGSFISWRCTSRPTVGNGDGNVVSCIFPPVLVDSPMDGWVAAAAATCQARARRPFTSASFPSEKGLAHFLTSFSAEIRAIHPIHGETFAAQLNLKQHNMLLSKWH